jgi:hypothetical protein
MKNILAFIFAIIFLILPVYYVVGWWYITIRFANLDYELLKELYNNKLWSYFSEKNNLKEIISILSGFISMTIFIYILRDKNYKNKLILKLSKVGVVLVATFVFFIVFSLM